MGQYYKPVNITKKEYLYSHTFGDGLKLCEFGFSSMGMMAGLAILLADGNGNGGGDISEDPVSGIVGRWKGDRIVIAGDYAPEGKFVTQKDVEGFVDDKGNPVNRRKTNLYRVATEKFKDISYDVLFALMAENYFREDKMKSLEGRKYKDDKDNIIRDFNAIHEQRTKGIADMPLLIGRLTTPEGKGILEKFLKGK
jgi:hypothetical protein